MRTLKTNIFMSDKELCHHTIDIRHAKNYREMSDGSFWEVCDDEA